MFRAVWPSKSGCKWKLPAVFCIFVRHFFWVTLFMSSLTESHLAAAQSAEAQSEFDDIRPYNDNEVRPTIARLIGDNEFVDTVARLKFPTLSKFAAPLLRPVVRAALRHETADVATVDNFQQRIEKYMRRLLDRTVTELTVSGLEYLTQSRAYCFVSNHRDIAMDPAFVNWTLYHNGFQTLRIAIGDNLLTKPFASDLMRLNKSFIVNRSATAPKEKLRAARKLSAYIHHSVVNDNANIWIAQREGRAKDGVDKTNPAIISMLAMSRAKTETLGDYLSRANIVPVSISYEWDPCDADKARELTILKRDGRYVKGEHEDVRSIAKGISGFKGRVHLAFGEPLSPAITTVDEAVAVMDDAIIDNYVLHASNCVAYEMIEGKAPDVIVGVKGVPFAEIDASAARRMLKARLEACDPEWRDMMLRIYANPVYTKLHTLQESDFTESDDRPAAQA
jgi:1-acyl-sn-glycerol-3-phosphate acyltransferase